MRKIEKKVVVKKYTKPQKRLMDKHKSINQQDAAGKIRSYDFNPVDKITCSIVQRLVLLMGPNAREYARSQQHYRLFSDIKSWKAISMVIKMYICRERMIDDYLERQRAIYLKRFIEKYNIPFSLELLNTGMLKTMGIVR